MEFRVEMPSGIVYLIEKDMRGNGDWFIDTSWISSTTPAGALQVMRTAKSALPRPRFRVAEYQVWADSSMTCLRTFTRLPRTRRIERADFRPAEEITITASPIYPPGSPEYETYRQELRVELDKFARGEPSYN